MFHNHLGALLAAGSTVALACAAPALAQLPDERVYSLPAQELSKSLREVSRQSGRNIIAPSELVEGRQAPAVSGPFTAEGVVGLLLTGSGLQVRRVGDSLVISSGADVESAPPDALRQASSNSADETIVVTGSRIRGAPVASPVIRLSDERIRDEGQATLAEAVRTIPQNFGGGQNPGVGNNVPATSGVNVGSATSINLRGLGSDATLTLLNGHRLSYSASRQSIDVSSIPLAAVARIEVVPDGASALYGSDAVAGVANIILKRDYDGVEARARLGSSTDGGNFEQRYSALAGRRWGSGGFIASYEFGRSAAIEGRKRSYTRLRTPSLTLFPFLRNHSAVLSGHQDFPADVQLEIDALYNKRFSDASYASNPAGNVGLSGFKYQFNSESFVIAPTLRFSGLGAWRLFLTGSYGQDHTRFEVTNFSGGTPVVASDNCYCNDAIGVEAGGEGALFRLPGGPVKAALGTGYRRNDFVRFNGPAGIQNVTASQDGYYAYGELSLPIVSEEQDIRLIRTLSASAALRYENYRGVGSVATPKFGIIYAPVADVSIKGSWGKSFRAPTLSQRYQNRTAVLVPPSVFGGTGYPRSATAFLLQGGNVDLKPERATSWSVTLDLHPRALPGLELEASYFSTRYRDRVVVPIAFLSQALSNPIYRSLVTANPSKALLDETIASSVSFINATGRPYNPADVVAYIDDRNLNAGYQKIEGGDLLVTYRRDLGRSAGTLGVQLNATYLASEQQLGPGQPILPLAGILFNPPHVRARGGLSWAKGPFTATGNLTYVGGVLDTRRPVVAEVDPMTTLDLTLRYRSPADSGPLAGLDVSLSVQNISNAKPGTIATTLFTDAPYDSTNYSPVGRFIALAVSKSW
jgi:outer membrane receptor protein involved in Fe transport